jgi:lipoprotein-anchoring transpeptidase ErfK/SrfK
VLAYRKVNRMARNFSASKAIFARLARKRGKFVVRYPRHGKHLEADLTRQVVALVDRKGKLFRVIHTSSGTSATPTVLGSFRFYLKQPGYNARRMLHSNYFHGGYAIHGFDPVPTHPASHGCLRIPISNARFVNRWIRIGDRIDVYRS